ncbi:MAG: zinc-ribbon domain-containing protein [Clostridia bacterium]|nr:zinc-ribbon domain-containing protein [Clostridia bacterium]
MKICSNCKKELIDEAKFCSECGLEIKEKKLCQNCGGELKDDMKFCVKCGTAVALVQDSENEPAREAEPVKEAEPVNEAEPVEEASAVEIKEDTAPRKVKKSNYILSLAFGIASLVCAVLSADNFLKTILFFLPSMVVFLILSKCFTRQYYKEADSENKFIKAARILTRIALPVGIVFACLSFVSAVVSFFTSSFWQEILVFIEDLFYEIETELLYELGLSK